MKITIEPTEDQLYRPSQSADTMHSKVSISIASDDLDIGETMGQVVKALQAWGFHNESIAGHLDEELSWQLGLGRRNDQATMLESIYQNALDSARRDEPPEETFMKEAGGVFTSTTADAISKDVMKNDPALEQDDTPEYGRI